MFHILWLIVIAIFWMGAGFNYALVVMVLYGFIDYHRARRIDNKPLVPKKVKNERKRFM